MAKTTHLSLASGWTLAAVGGMVTATNDTDNHVRWAVTDDMTAPTFSGGHLLRPSSNESYALETTEHLWMKGPASVYITAANPAGAA